MSHGVEGGRGADRRDAGQRKQGGSPVARRREAEQEEVLVGGGGAGWRMQWREVEQAAQGRSVGTEEAAARGRAARGGTGGRAAGG
jgi:hypothetical protein